jgi:short-subunit dehydrogenase
VLKVNLCGTIDVTLAAYGLMRGRGGGTIVNLASMSTFLLPPLFAPYITSKAAIVGFSRALSIEAEIHGVNVAVACPGNVRTPMLGGWKQSPLTPAMDAGEAAATILAGVDKGRKMMVFPLYAKAFYFLDRLDGAILNPFRREILRRARLRKRAPDQV